MGIYQNPNKSVHGNLALTLTGGTYNLSDIEAQNSSVDVSGVLTSNLIVTIPATADAAHTYIFDNLTTGAFTMTVKVFGGALGVVVAQTEIMDGYSNGSEFEAISTVPVTGPVASIFGRGGAVIAALGDYIAGQITNTPSGGVAGLTVQAAIDELDAEKAGLAGMKTYAVGATWTKPANLKRIKVTVTGGGGAGYSGDSTGYSGSAGGTSIKIIEAAALGATETVTVGAGGAAGSPPTAGGTSSFGAHCSATGGTGGFLPNTANYPRGGAGAGGDINITGGSAGYNNGSGGGCSIYGGGGGSSNMNGTYAHGSAGSCGGGGGAGYTAAGNGGAGGAGLVVIEEFI